MRQIAKYFALLMLLVLIAPSMLYLAGRMELEAVKTVMLVATVLWFIAASLWMWHEEPPAQQQQPD